MDYSNRMIIRGFNEGIDAVLKRLIILFGNINTRLSLADYKYEAIYCFAAFVQNYQKVHTISKYDAFKLINRFNSWVNDNAESTIDDFYASVKSLSYDDISGV